MNISKIKSGHGDHRWIIEGFVGAQAPPETSSTPWKTVISLPCTLASAWMDRSRWIAPLKFWQLSACGMEYSSPALIVVKPVWHSNHRVSFCKFYSGKYLGTNLIVMSNAWYKYIAGTNIFLPYTIHTYAIIYIALHYNLQSPWGTAKLKISKGGSSKKLGGKIRWYL